MFGWGKKIFDLLGEIRSELRRIRIAQEEVLDIWRAAKDVTDPLGEVPPSPIREGETPPERPRRSR